MAYNHNQIKIFLAHAEENIKARERLDRHLVALKRKNIIKTWHEGAIPLGSRWDKAALKAFENSELIILIVSVDFIASEYLYDLGVYKALDRHRKGEARVIPLILDHCGWRDTPLADIQPFPKDGDPLTEWDSLDKGLTSFVMELREIINEMKKVKKKSTYTKKEKKSTEIKIDIKDLEKLVEHNMKSRNRVYINELDILKRKVQNYRDQIKSLQEDNRKLRKALAVKNKKVRVNETRIGDKGKVKIKLDGARQSIHLRKQLQLNRSKK